VGVLTCAEVRELAPELALGQLGGPERAEALVHLDDCAPCRGVVGELTDAADALTLAAPEAEPPSGFEHRTVAALPGARRRSVRRWVAVVAATAAAATIISVATVRVVDRGRDPVTVAISETRMAGMVGDDGADVGWAFVSDGDPAAISVAVWYDVPTGQYEIELQTADGDTVVVGDMTVVDGIGAWSGTADVPDDTASVALLAPDGHAVCEGELAS
jgi:hypothetical protein